VAAHLGRLAIAEDFLINCFPFLSNFIETLNTLNNSKSEQGTMCLQGGVRDQIEAVELTGWSASERGGRAADGVGAQRWTGTVRGVGVMAQRRPVTGWGVGVGVSLVSGMLEDG
jgi:hypothetical protein